MSDVQQQADSLMASVKKHQSGESSELMTQMGATYTLNYGISVVKLESLAKPYGRNQALSNILWAKEAREAKLLAFLTADPAQFSAVMASEWTHAFTTAEMCEQACMHLYPYLPFAVDSALDWCQSDKEYVKTTGFVLASRLARVVTDLSEQELELFLPLTVSASETLSVHVRRAVGRALVDIGRISIELNIESTKCCRKIRQLNTHTAKWIAEEALWQLEFFGEQLSAGE